MQDFPGGLGVDNLSAHAGEEGLIPCPERFHMPKGNEVLEQQLLSPPALEPVLSKKRSHRDEKPAPRNKE